ncbi:MAG: OadG family protein [Clostridia bacterium]|jgi:DNA-binding NarL/FixJ family response regulator
MSDSLLQTLTGFLAVIVGMLLLTGIIIVFSMIMGKNNKKKTQTVLVEKKPVEQIIDILDDNDDEKVIAAIMASVYAYLQQNNIKNVCNIVIRPLIRTSSSSSWSHSGRMQNSSRNVQR